MKTKFLKKPLLSFGLLFIALWYLFRGKKAGPAANTATITYEPANEYKLFADAYTPQIAFTGAFTWGNFVRSNEVSNYLTVIAGTGTSGANAVQTIDATQDFTLVIDISWPEETNGITVFFSENNDTIPDSNTLTTTGLSFVSGVRTDTGMIAIGTTWGNLGIVTNNMFLFEYPAKIRIRKSGNDLIYDYLQGLETEYTEPATHTGVLAGKTTLYLKSLIQSPNIGQKVKVSKI